MLRTIGFCLLLWLNNVLAGEYVYYAADKPPEIASAPPEAPLCYKFRVLSLEAQLSKLEKKYGNSLYDVKITTNVSGGRSLSAKRKDDFGQEIQYAYFDNAEACDKYQKDRISSSQSAVVGEQVPSAAPTASKTDENEGPSWTLAFDVRRLRDSLLDITLTDADKEGLEKIYDERHEKTLEIMEKYLSRSDALSVFFRIRNMTPLQRKQSDDFKRLYSALNDVLSLYTSTTWRSEPVELGAYDIEKQDFGIPDMSLPGDYILDFSPDQPGSGYITKSCFAGLCWLALKLNDEKLASRVEKKSMLYVLYKVTFEPKREQLFSNVEVHTTVPVSHLIAAYVYDKKTKEILWSTTKVN